MKPMHIPDGSGERLVFPDTIELTILIPGAATNGGFAIFEDVVAPGIGPGRHIHKLQDEVFFVLEGTFDIEIGGQLYRAGPGDVAFVPRGEVHAFKNIGTAPGRLRYTFTPAGDTEALFRAFYEAAQSERLTPDIMSEIAEKHDQVFVGPPL